MNHKYRVLFILLLTACCTGINAQNWIGYSSSNYAGSNGIYVNPSSIAGSKVKFNFNLVGLGANANNDYYAYRAPFSLWNVMTRNVPPQYQNADGSPRLEDEYFMENINGKSKNLNMSTEVRGPSFMVKLNQKSSFALSTRFRTALQFFDVDEGFARMARFGLDTTGGNPAFVVGGQFSLKYGQVKDDNKFSLNFNAFTEYNGTYAMQVYDNGKHYVKAGATVKYLLGAATAYLLNKGIKYEIAGPDSIVFYNYDIEYGYTREDYFYNITDNGRFSDPFTPSTALGRGIGLDLGATYEYRPKKSKYMYYMDGRHWENPERSKYLFKLGVSLVDMGSIKYKAGENIASKSYYSNTPVYWGQIDTFDIGTFGDVNTRDGFDYADSVLSFIFPGSVANSAFKSKLPTALNINFDYKLTESIFVNAMWIQSLRKKNTIGMRQQSILSVTPRIESRWTELSIPLMLANDYSYFQFGLFFKAGPFYVGSDNLVAVFAKNKKAYGTDIYFGISFNIYDRKHRDRDNDSISDKRDKCKSKPGPEWFQGCPDTDHDSIPDKLDKCPTVAGLPQYQGCPDTDGDGIQDTEDSCITEPGIPAFAGCPDTDGDSIPDKRDDCPTAAGPLMYRGCPDTDGDGILNNNDSCPEKPGIPQFNGCPDTDGDGIPDSKDRCPEVQGPDYHQGCPDYDNDRIPDIDDKCPEQPGLIEFSGCPDTDKDSVPDNIDLCPIIAGPPANNGCPRTDIRLELLEIPKEDQEILKEAFDNLEFETGKATISSTSYSSLNELVKLLEKRPQYRIYIAGHTDNVGKPAANLKLSQDRANAVRKYLMNKGVSSDRIIAEGFGQTRPVDDNATPAGRQHNRRVEFRVVK